MKGNSISMAYKTCMLPVSDSYFYPCFSFEHLVESGSSYQPTTYFHSHLLNFSLKSLAYYLFQAWGEDDLRS